MGRLETVPQRGDRAPTRGAGLETVPPRGTVPQQVTVPQRGGAGLDTVPQRGCRPRGGGGSGLRTGGRLGSRARGNGQPRLRLFGLLQDPAEWLAALKRTGAGHSGIRPPKWLSPKHFDPAAIEAVEQAVRSIGILPSPSGRGAGGEGGLQSSLTTRPWRPVGVAQQSTPLSLRERAAEGGLQSPSIFGVLPEHLQRGLAAASHWAAAHQAARWLGSLMAKLARLSVLERSLGEAVEAEKIAAMAEFAAGAGHEINNPLAVIAGRAQLLLRDEADPERRRDLALMNAQAMRVNEMIADLRLFATPPELERQSLDLTALVRRVIDEMQPLAAAQETVLVPCRGTERGPGRGRSRAVDGGHPSALPERPGGPGASRPDRGCGQQRWRRSARSRLPTTGRASWRSSGRTSSSPSIPPGRLAAGSAWGCRSAGGS